MLRQERVIFDKLLLFCISVEFLIFPVVVSIIPLGSKLSVGENNSWVSSNGDFTLGFCNFSNRYSLGIQFNTNSIPANKQTLVWVAGADLTVSSSSYFQLTKEGLVLFDSSLGVTVWISQTRNASVSSAILHDNGNLVLLNQSNIIVWQSFDNPSDTLLPDQNLKVLQYLRPPRWNPLPNYYSLFMDVSGQLLLRFETTIIYWTSGNSSQSAVRAILTSDGTFQLLNKRSKSVWSVVGEDHNDSDVKFRFLRLDADGNLRLYSWEEASGTWRSVWQAVGNQCNVFATCGLHGICVFSASGSQICRCPFTSINESNAECLVPYQENCKSGSSMVRYEHTSLYGIYPPNDTVIQTNLLQCQRLCQEDPSCFAVTFKNDGTAQCLMKKTRYISGQSDPSLTSISFIKTCSDPIAVIPIFPKSTPSSQPESFCVPCLAGVGTGAFVAFLVIQLGIGFFVYMRKSFATSAHMDPNAKGCVELSYSEIKSLTNNFKHQLGPKVFKGLLPNNRQVAVKGLDSNIDERKFRSMVSKIGNVHKKNLVKLDGYCCEAQHKFLVYEFARNGSLGKCLEDPRICKRLTWGKRMEICLSVARSISYLHTGCREFVNHGNLKCENVLLDENLEAKVSEFGLETMCYESMVDGKLAERDIGDFGRLVLMLISGHQNTIEVCEGAYEKWAAGETDNLVDKRIKGGVNSLELERVLRIIFWCLQADERMRPSMGEVVLVLEGTMSVDRPPPPSAGGNPWKEEEPLRSDPEQ